MKLKYATMTGADDSIDPEELHTLSLEFPFVEWGILVSTRPGFRPRMPSDEWIFKLICTEEGCCEVNPDIQLSLHVCGEPVRKLLQGKYSRQLNWLLAPQFERFQVNTHAEKHDWTHEGLTLLRLLQKTPIFQLDGINEAIVADAEDAAIDPHVIFDLSHGAGVLPESWVKPKNVHSTYAGGLGPHNLEEQLKKIADLVGDQEVSIDMETHIRSNDDKTFDLDKVTTCLEIAKKYVA